MIRVTHDRVLIRPVRPTPQWVKDAAGDDAELQRLAQGLAHPYGEPVTMGEVVSLGPIGLVPMADVRAVFADVHETGVLLEGWEVTARLQQIAPAVPDFAVGDVVVFSAYTGQEFHLPDDEFIVLWADDVLGVVEPRAANEEPCQTNS